MRPYKKLIPVLEKYPDDIIVTADDDIFYRPDWLKILYDEHLKSPDCLVAHYGYRIRLDTFGKVYPRQNWYWLFTPGRSSPAMLANSSGTGGGGITKKIVLS